MARRGEATCIDIIFHEGCVHGGWREVSPKMVLPQLTSARRAATYAQNDLGLEIIRLRFFEPGPIVRWTPGDPDVDADLLKLNVGPFDPELRGKTGNHEANALPWVWVRAGLSPVGTAVVVLHEARHLWQARAQHRPANEDKEEDANEYAWPAARRMGFPDTDLAAAFREL